jgi:hypothetical protein
VEVKDLMFIEMVIVVVLILIVMVAPSLAKRAIIAVLVLVQTVRAAHVLL